MNDGGACLAGETSGAAIACGGEPNREYGDEDEILGGVLPPPPPRQMALAAMAVGAGVAVADEGGDGRGFQVIFSSEGPTNWVITGAACSTIPDDAVITGTGTNSLVIKERINRDGTATLMFTGKARGTAVDQDGNSYRWSYNNHERATNTLAEPDVYNGPISDSFVLSGQGPLRIKASFLGNITENLTLGTFAIVPTKVIGDPINFATNESHCDPI